MDTESIGPSPEEMGLSKDDMKPSGPEKPDANQKSEPGNETERQEPKAKEDEAEQSNETTPNEPREVESHFPEDAEVPKVGHEGETPQPIEGAEPGPEGEQVSGAARPQSEKSKRIHREAARSFPSREQVERHRTTEASKSFLARWGLRLKENVGVIAGGGMIIGGAWVKYFVPGPEGIALASGLGIGGLSMYLLSALDKDY